jgi:hypothetical protein
MSIYKPGESFTDNLIRQFDEIDAKLRAKDAEIERLTLDIQILTEELERERRPKRDER